MVKKPCWARTLPCPWQAVQLVGPLPGAAPEPSHVSQVTEAGILILVSLPL